VDRATRAEIERIAAATLGDAGLIEPPLAVSLISSKYTLYVSSHAAAFNWRAGCVEKTGPASSVDACRMKADGAMELQKRRQEILDIAASHGARNVRLFGSVARGEDNPASDLDLLVEMESDRSLLDLVGLGQDLEELLARKVDVLTDASLHPALRDRILAEARPL
jgi:predicted nucleotidyltransferase